MIQHLNPRPGLRYSGAGARVVEPDVYFTKDGDDYIIQMNDEDVPQLRLNAQYRRMLDRENGATKEVRDYVRERYTSAIQLMKNIEQRKQTILKVCQAIVRRQSEFLAHGLDQLKPMMIKEVAEEVGVHPSTVSRAVASKYVHTPQGVFELRYFFSEAVQGPLGGGTPLLLLKRKVKKMIEEEDRSKPLTDEQITMLLQARGDQRHPAYGCEIPGRHENPVDPPAPRPQLGISANLCGREWPLARQEPRYNKRGVIFRPSRSRKGEPMKITYTGRQVELAPAQLKKLEARFAKIGKLLDGRREVETHVILSLERHLHCAEATINYYNHQMVGVGSNSDLFNAIAAAAEKLEKQAVKARTKWRDTKRTPRKAQPEVARPQPFPRPRRRPKGASTASTTIRSGSR